jgi:hypothetical protein
MSAFQVSNAHIDALVHARSFCRYGQLLAGKTDTDVGQLLIRENMRSLAFRYRDQPVNEKAIARYSFRGVRKSFTVVELIKAVHCYQYQACEHDGWEASDAARYCLDLLDVLVHALTGYSEAAWGIESDTPKPAPVPPPAPVAPSSPIAAQNVFVLGAGKRRPVRYAST